jgi:inorganic triphosphatase YgiF
MPTEVEAKFRADGEGPLRWLESTARLGEAELGEPRSVDEVDMYLDTWRGTLGVARWACRLRRRGDRVIVSLKGPAEAGSGGWLHRRPEVEGPATDSLDPHRWPPSAARHLVDALRAGEPLVERLTLRQRRVERSVRAADRPVGVLTLDRVGVEHEGRSVGEMQVVELELAAGAPPEHEELLRGLADALGAVPGLEAEGRSKLEHALELVGAS